MTNSKDTFQKLFYRFLQTENLYLKFILTIIAIALIVIAVELNDKLPFIIDALWRIYQVI